MFHNENQDQAIFGLLVRCFCPRWVRFRTPALIFDRCTTSWTAYLTVSSEDLLLQARNVIRHCSSSHWDDESSHLTASDPGQFSQLCQPLSYINKQPNQSWFKLSSCSVSIKANTYWYLNLFYFLMQWFSNFFLYCTPCVRSNIRVYHQRKKLERPKNWTQKLIYWFFINFQFLRN